MNATSNQIQHLGHLYTSTWNWNPNMDQAFDIMRSVSKGFYVSIFPFIFSLIWFFFFFVYIHHCVNSDFTLQQVLMFFFPGYGRELNYRRSDKSFSAFGNRRPGSTWFVKSFLIFHFPSRESFTSYQLTVQLFFLQRNSRRCMLSGVATRNEVNKWSCWHVRPKIKKKY